MKTSILITLFLSLVCLYSVKSQNIPIYPIPSYNILVNGIANFKNAISHGESLDSPMEKRDANVHLSSGPIGNPDCRATVWLYSLDQTTILGPYEVACGETLTVEIDERDWGVIVQSDTEVIVDVWFD
jgi:hypothetical protein